MFYGTEQRGRGPPVRYLERKEALNEAIQHFHAADTDREREQLIGIGGSQSQDELDEDIDIS